MKTNKGKWRTVVAGMVVAAVAALGGGNVSAADYNRVDNTDLHWTAPAAWDVAGGPSAPVNVPPATDGAILDGSQLTNGVADTLVGAGETIDGILVKDAGWGLDGSLTSTQGIHVEKLGTLTLKNNSGTGTNPGLYNLGGVLLQGAMNVETGAQFGSATPITLDGGTLGIIQGNPSLTNVNSPSTVDVLATGGTVFVADGINLAHTGNLNVVQNGTLTKTGAGTLDMTGAALNFDATSNLAVDNGTFDATGQSLELTNVTVGKPTTNGKLLADNLTVTKSFDDTAGNPTWGLLASETVLTGKATFDTQAVGNIRGSFSAEQALIQDGSKVTLFDDSTVKINDLISTDAVKVDGAGSTLTIQTRANFLTSPNITLNDGGKLEVTKVSGPAVVNSPSNIFITGTGGNVDVASGITATVDGNVDVAANSVFNKTGTGNLVFGGNFTDQATSQTSFTGKAEFNNFTTIEGAFNTDYATFNDGATINGNLNAADDVAYTGPMTINGRLGTNDLSGFGDVIITGTTNLRGSNVIPENAFGQKFAGNIGGNMTIDGGSLAIGTFDSDKSKNVAALLAVEGNLESNGGEVHLAIDSTGTFSQILVEGSATDVSGSTKIVLDTRVNNEANINKLGSRLTDASGNPSKVAILAEAGNGAGSDASAISMDSFSTSKYDFWLDPNGTFINSDPSHMYWTMGAEMQSGGLPSVSSMFLVNIIGFDLPRAQNVSGPWIRTKGGHVYDNLSDLGNVSYQVMQIGWDKSFQAANGNGEWYTGIFLEGDWMYSTGDYRIKQNRVLTTVGAAKASSTGMGTGLYVSRSFENGWYFDMIGRINLYESKNSAWATQAGDENRYGYKETTWTDQMFAMGMEIGKTFNSRNKRWSFNPYERVIYNSTPGNEFRLEYNDATASDSQVRNYSVDAWTNQLGAMLAYNSLDRDGNTLGNVFVKAEYFQGLSGNFDTYMLNYDDSNKFVREGSNQKVEAGRTKNNLAYGNMGVGTMYKPVDSVVVSAQTDFIFGDVSGWSVTFGGRYSY